MQYTAGAHDHPTKIRSCVALRHLHSRARQARLRRLSAEANAAEESGQARIEALGRRLAAAEAEAEARRDEREAMNARRCRTSEEAAAAAEARRQAAVSG